MQLTPKQIEELRQDGSFEQILEECYKNLETFLYVFFPKTFFRPFGKQHKMLFEVLDDQSIEKLVIMAFRGFGKSSIIRGYASKLILYQDSNFIMPISASSALAIQQSENLKNMITGNPLIRKIWGQTKPEGIEVPYSKELWRVNVGNKGKGTYILPRGAGQKVRGMNIHDSRPDLLLIDDLEDPEVVVGESAKEKLKTWFYASLINVIDRGDKSYAPEDIPDWRQIAIGTLPGQDSLLRDLVNSKNWETVSIPLAEMVQNKVMIKVDNKLEEQTQVEYRTKWPEYMTSQQVNELASDMRDDGRLDEFFREYLNLAISMEDNSINTSMFKHYSPEDEWFQSKKDDFAWIVLVDIARTAKLHSSNSAVIGVGIDIYTHTIVVHEVVSYKMHPNELEDEIFGMCARLGASAFGVEVTGLHEYITYPLQNSMARQNLHYHLVELHARGNKELRARPLIPLYKKGLIWHNKNTTAQLEADLVMFPNPELWDRIDALAYITEALEQGDKFFLYKADDEESTEDDEDDYQELLKQDEAELDDGWQHV